MIQFIQAVVVFHLQPFPEVGLAQVTVAFAAVLIRDMPANNCRMIRVTLSQFAVQQGCLLPVHRRCIAVVVPDTMQIAHAVSFYPQHFRIFL
ncbi:hypothetical protein D3C74_448070 [compost metagenome]